MSVKVIDTDMDGTFLNDAKASHCYYTVTVSFSSQENTYERKSYRHRHGRYFS